MSASQFLMSYMIGLSHDPSRTRCNLCREVAFASHRGHGVFGDMMEESCEPTDCTLKALTRLCVELGESITNFHEKEDDQERARRTILGECDAMLSALFLEQERVRTLNALTDAQPTLDEACDTICHQK